VAQRGAREQPSVMRPRERFWALCGDSGGGCYEGSDPAHPPVGLPPRARMDFHSKIVRDSVVSSRERNESRTSAANPRYVAFLRAAGSYDLLRARCPACSPHAGTRAQEVRVGMAPALARVWTKARIRDIARYAGAIAIGACPDLPLGIVVAARTAGAIGRTRSDEHLTRDVGSGAGLPRALGSAVVTVRLRRAAHRASRLLRRSAAR
jgi:hypothetical protein